MISNRPNSDTCRIWKTGRLLCRLTRRGKQPSNVTEVTGPEAGLSMPSGLARLKRRSCRSLLDVQAVEHGCSLILAGLSYPSPIYALERSVHEVAWMTNLGVHIAWLFRRSCFSEIKHSGHKRGSMRQDRQAQRSELNMTSGK